MDIFKRNNQSSRRQFNIGLILTLLAAALCGYSYYSDQNKLATPIAYDSENVNQSNYYKVNVVGFSPMIMYKGDTEEKADSKVFYGITDQDDFILVNCPDKESYQAIESAVDAEGNLAQPRTMIGSFSGMDNTEREIARDAWVQLTNAEADSIDDKLSHLNYYFVEDKMPMINSLLYIGGAMAGIIGIIMVALGWSGKRNYRKYLEAFKQEYPKLRDLKEIDTNAQLVRPRSGLLIYEPFLFSDKAPLGMVDLRQVNWIYLNEETINNVPRYLLEVHTNDHKQYSYLVKGNLDQAQEDLIPFYQYIRENHPQIKLGYN